MARLLYGGDSVRVKIYDLYTVDGNLLGRYEDIARGNANDGEIPLVHGVRRLRALRDPWRVELED